MSEYFLALEHQSLFIVPMEKVMNTFSCFKGKNFHHLETLDEFTGRFSDAKHLYEFLRRYSIIPEDVQEGSFLLIQVSKSLHVSTMEVRYFGMDGLFYLETLMDKLSRLYDMEGSYITYKIGWEIKNPSLMRRKNEMPREDFINTCKKYILTSGQKVDYIKLRKIAMITARYQQEGNPNVTKTEKLVYQKSYWVDVE